MVARSRSPRRSRLLVITGVAAAVIVLPATVAASASTAAPATTCPTVDPTTGAVSPAPTAGQSWPGCDLSGADLAGATLTGANLNGADLSNADLSNASVKQIDLANADLSGASLAQDNLQEAILSDTIMATTDLTGVSSGLISGTPASLPTNWEFINAFLVGPTADLEFAGLGSGDFTNADLSSADLSHARLTDAVLTGADLADATLTSVISGGIVGKAASLPTNWSLQGGNLIGPGADLESSVLAGLDLSGDSMVGVDLSSADLDGTNLTDANLKDANFDGANLKDAVFTGATLTGATSGELVGTPAALPAGWLIEGGFLIGPGADLENAALTGLDLHGDDLDGTDLAHAVLVSANLTSADLDHANLSNVQFEHATLTDATLSQANLTSALLDLTDLSGASFAGANLTDASMADLNLAGANLAGATLDGVGSAAITGTPTALPAHWLLRGGYLIGTGASLTDATLDKLNLNGADLDHASLVEASMQHTKLGSANLTFANLSGVNFSFADLSHANLSNANLESANFALANLTDANLTGATVTSASFPEVTWDNTICPDGSNSNAYVDGCFTPRDTQAPVAAPAITGTKGKAGWYVTKVTVNWNWTDNGTIAVSDCTQSSAATGSGVVKLTASCSDEAGNTRSASETVKVDTQRPTVTLTGVQDGAVYALGHVPTAACHTTEPVSGVGTPAALTLASPAKGGLGLVTATCAGATSVAGQAQAHPVTVRYSVEYGFAGFSAPKPNSTVAKSSHQVTVRFQLDGATGSPLAPGIAQSLATGHKVEVTLAGPGIKAVATLCDWASSTRTFKCLIPIPTKVETGSATYTITASEKLGPQFEKAPASAKANPDHIHFR